MRNKCNEYYWRWCLDKPEWQKLTNKSRNWNLHGYHRNYRSEQIKLFWRLEQISNERWPKKLWEWIPYVWKKYTTAFLEKLCNEYKTPYRRRVSRLDVSGNYDAKSDNSHRKLAYVYIVPQPRKTQFAIRQTCIS